MIIAKRNIVYLLSMGLILISLTTRIFAQNELMTPSSTILLNNTSEETTNFKVTSDLGSTLNGEQSITNNGEETIEDLMLEFDFVKAIEEFWTSVVLEYKDEDDIINNSQYDLKIKPTQILRLWFGGNPGDVDSEPKNHVVEEIDYEKDSDEDGLPDYFEKELGTDSNNEDSDGDKISDEYEYFCLHTNTLKSDTDGNGTLDGDEDFDEDGLINFKEYIFRTNPHNDDTDSDDLEDKDEIVLYGSNPLDRDTDDDKLEDGDEILLGFNVLNPDSDGNGILDGDEKTYQIYSENISEQEKPEIVKVLVSLEGSGNLQKTTHIHNRYNIDILSSEVVGIVGVPVEISTTSKFDKATITFEYDESKLGNVPEENLCVMWYDKDEYWYKILDQSSIVDTKNNTISSEIEHFGTYLVVDKEVWYRVWR